MHHSIKTIDDFGWFSDVLIAAQEQNSTDLFILEDEPVRLGILKRYTSLEPIIRPSSSQIKDLFDATYVMPSGGRDYSNAGDFSTDLRNGGIEYCFTVESFGRFRVSMSRSEEGYGMSIRKLSYKIPSFDDLNTFGNLNGIKHLLNYQYRCPSGLILHTGITGSGKTTMIAGEIAMLAQRTDGAILTFESPIEYLFDFGKAPKRQYEIGRHISNYAAALKMSLRNDPSVILIGEVRDKEEFQAMIDTAERGHLLFSTMHTGGVIDTLRFLDGMGDSQTVWRQQLASSITAIVSQKLLYKQEHGFFIAAEVLIPDHRVKQQISTGEWNSITALLNGKQLKNGSISFGDAIQTLVDKKILVDRERRELSSGMINGD